MDGTPRRWLPSFRAAVLAAALLLGSAGAVALFRGGDQAEVASVNLPAKGSEATAGGGDGAGSPSSDSPDSDSPGSGSDGPEQESSGTEAASGGERADGDPSGADVGRAAGSSPAVLVIHVAGAVSRPGVVRVPEGSRAGDAVDAAGGPAGDADLAGVNLAAALQDGMMVVVPRMGESPPLPAAGGGSQLQSAGAGTGAGSGAGPGGLINLNTASAVELDALPRVGPVIAERIVQWRTDHGKFTRPEDLDAVPGIGEAMLAALLPLVTV